MTSPEPEVPGTGSDITGTGSDVFSDGKPLSSRKNRSWAQDREKPLGERGLKVQSPILAAGVILQSKKRHFYVGKKIF